MTKSSLPQRAGASFYLSLRNEFPQADPYQIYTVICRDLLTDHGPVMAAVKLDLFAARLRQLLQTQS